jgi:hypothetical protein
MERTNRDLKHVNEEYMLKCKKRIEKIFDVEAIFKMMGASIEDIDDQYPGYSAYVKGMMTEISSIMDDAVEYAIAQDMMSNKQNSVNQIMVGMIERQRRQMILMDAKLDILLDIKEKGGDRS